MKTHVVYWIHLPNTNIKKDGYVGVTNNFKTRMNAHKSDAKYGRHRNNYLQNVINKYNDQLIYEIIFEGSEEGCYQIEEYFRPDIKIGWNISIGGQIPNKNRQVSEETRKRWSDFAKAKGCAHLHTPESWAKISKAMQGEKNHQASSVRCIELNLTFPTCTAAGKYFNVSHSAISACCRGKAKKIKGYTFEYTNK